MGQPPQPASAHDPIASPKDIDFPGVIRLQVDATDLERGIFRVQERIPVPSAGPLTLLFPKWLPGYHAPQSPIAFFAGLEISVNGEPLTWVRDEVEVYAFHIMVPESAEHIDAKFQFVSPTNPTQGRITVTPEMLNLQWNALTLYPAGYFSRRIRVAASVKMPENWAFGCALAGTATGEVVAFDTVALDVLIDSPVFVGRYYRRIALDEQATVQLNLVADRPELLEASADQIAPHRALVAQADKLFGKRPFDTYDFLVALSDELGAIGCEHHRSTEIQTSAGYFTSWHTSAPSRDVMAHEYTHAWNGKFRRGVDSWTPSFEHPIRNSLMWVYEGQTQYWGNVLSTRSGLWSFQDALDALALTAATCEHRAGRRWRAVADTTRDPIIASRAPLPWVSWQRSEDYYAEGQLMWLDVDTRIRTLSQDTRSLDTFARRFFGNSDGSGHTSTYDFDEVVRTLSEVQEFDWAGFLEEKLHKIQALAPFDGIERGGYKLVYRDSPSSFGLDSDRLADSVNFKFSIGLAVAGDGKVKEVLWESPAFAAGLTTGCQLVAVHGREYNANELKQAIVTAQRGEPILLSVKRGKRHRVVTVNYTGGLRYPHLEPIAGARRRLDEIYAAR